MASLTDILKRGKAMFAGKKPAMKKVTDEQRLKKLGKGTARQAGEAIKARKNATEALLKEL